MSAPVLIWLEVSHHAAFRLGGWAWVRKDAGGITGVAAGDRRIEAGRAALAALIAAIKDLPGGAEVEVRTASPGLLAIPPALAKAQAGEEAPAENLDLWAQLSALLGARKVRVVRAGAQAGTPGAFSAAWAELGRDKAKTGAFSAQIPKTNLAKVQGLPA